MNSQRVTLLVLLDLSAAFDTVDHAILLQRLTTDFGVREKAVEWFSWYLSGRSQRVLFEGATSDSFDLPFGVPPGSCLGPLLFVVYASELFEIVQAHLLNANGFADDTQLCLSFNPNSPAEQAKALDTMEWCSNDLHKWMYQNKLKINDDNTEFLIIGSRRQLLKINHCSVHVGTVDVNGSASQYQYALGYQWKRLQISGVQAKAMLYALGYQWKRLQISGVQAKAMLYALGYQWKRLQISGVQAKAMLYALGYQWKRLQISGVQAKAMLYALGYQWKRLQISGVQAKAMLYALGYQWKRLQISEVQAKAMLYALGYQWKGRNEHLLKRSLPDSVDRSLVSCDPDDQDRVHDGTTAAADERRLRNIDLSATDEERDKDNVLTVDSPFFETSDEESGSESEGTSSTSS
ncbi:hypothetical protein AWC38_SpisGene18255 [Stylophora pistillata]|uniref:Reverse transcriptase domain-containing protein n=1 Tax=Stylophora pistillata TaxID=50429 RepID=A0A2B4RMF0_STYPI|nr:hypothetical protein AWC38_SpisGene18255 [Stylophora pistillata]